jgi:hypothetical protein
MAKEYDTDIRTIGAIWRADKDKKYSASGKLDLGIDAEISFLIYKNDKKTKDSQPDSYIKVFVAKKGKKTTSPAPEPEPEDDDVPF